VNDSIWIYNQATKGDLGSEYNEDCIFRKKGLYLLKQEAVFGKS